MKIKILFLTALVLAVTSSGFAQKKTNTMTADAVVKDLYAAQKGKANPFFQTKSRTLIDKYFVKDLADMIWKDSVDAKGEVGAIDFDPLYNAQDTEITEFMVEKPREAGGADNAFVKVKFKNFGKAESVDYELRRENGGNWKIVGIYYSNGEDLGSILQYSQDAEFKKGYDQYNALKGDYMIGTKKCTITPTLNMMSYRVECEGEEGFRLYTAEGDEDETQYIEIDENGAEKSKFIFKNGETGGKFIDASGKELKVTRMRVQTSPAADETSGIRSVDFLNYKYESSSCAGDLGISKTVKVSRGEFKDGDNNFYNVFEDKISYGDLNADGIEDAVVAIACGNSAGSFRAFEVHAFTFENGKAKMLKHLNSTDLESVYKKSSADGFIVTIGEEGARIEDGKLIVEALTDGSNASPENVTTFTYKWNAGNFVLDGKPQTKPRS